MDATIVTPADVAPPDPPPVPTAPAAEVAPNPPPEPVASTAAPELSGVTPGTLDRRGKPFDPAKHIGKQHPKTGAWLPRGGRLPRQQSTPPVDAPKTPPAPSFIPRDVPSPPSPTEGAAPAPESPGVDCSEDAGETVAHGIQFITGIVLDAFEDSECSPAEHKRMAAALAAYFRSIGWKAAAGVGIVLVIVGYFLRTFRREKPRAKFRAWIHGAAHAPKDVTPEEKRPAPTKPPPPQEAPKFQVLQFPTT